MPILKVNQEFSKVIEVVTNDCGESFEYSLNIKQLEPNKREYSISRNKKEWYETRLGIGKSIKLSNPQEQKYMEVIEGDDVVKHKLLIIELLKEKGDLEYTIECWKKNRDKE